MDLIDFDHVLGFRLPFKGRASVRRRQVIFFWHPRRLENHTPLCLSGGTLYSPVQPINGEFLQPSFPPIKKYRKMEQIFLQDSWRIIVFNQKMSTVCLFCHSFAQLLRQSVILDQSINQGRNIGSINQSSVHYWDKSINQSRMLQWMNSALLDRVCLGFKSNPSMLIQESAVKCQLFCLEFLIHKIFHKIFHKI